jgi:hypothetical protein
MTTDNIIAVDPGGTTGYVIWRGYPTFGQCDNQLAFVDMCYNHMLDNPGGTIVIESYLITARTAKLTQQHEPLEIIGALRYLASRCAWNFVMQKPAEAKRFCDDDRLRKMGWFGKGARHSNDAARHLFLYLVKQGEINPVAVDQRAAQ